MLCEISCLDIPPVSPARMRFSRIDADTKPVDSNLVNYGPRTSSLLWTGMAVLGLAMLELLVRGSGQQIPVEQPPTGQKTRFDAEDDIDKAFFKNSKEPSRRNDTENPPPHREPLGIREHSPDHRHSPEIRAKSPRSSARTPRNSAPLSSQLTHSIQHLTPKRIEYCVPGTPNDIAKEFCRNSKALSTAEFPVDPFNTASDPKTNVKDQDLTPNRSHRSEIRAKSPRSSERILSNSA